MITKSKLFWWMWLVQSVFERVDVIGRFTVRHRENPTQFSHVNWCEKFQAWIWCEIFYTWNRCEFSIRHVQPCSTCEILNLHTFQTCFWCESGMKQAWSYENILYGKALQRNHPDPDPDSRVVYNVEPQVELSSAQKYQSDSTQWFELKSELECTFVMYIQ